MKKIVIAIVSHGHFDFISKNHSLVEIARNPFVAVIIKDNLREEKLKSYSEESNFTYIVSSDVMGFGQNNNYIFEYAKRQLSTGDDDWFIILNPDVTISSTEFLKLVAELNSGLGDFFTPNLFKNNNLSEMENSVRYFTTYSDLLNPFLKFSAINRPYDKNKLSNESKVEWASGAFLCIKFAKFESVKGFDDKYFMYYEDVDLCYRLKQKGTFLLFLKNVSAVHVGSYKNRSIMSKHFRWYLASLFKFLQTRRRGTQV